MPEITRTLIEDFSEFMASLPSDGTRNAAIGAWLEERGFTGTERDAFVEVWATGPEMTPAEARDHFLRHGIRHGSFQSLGLSLDGYFLDRPEHQDASVDDARAARAIYPGFRSVEATLRREGRFITMIRTWQTPTRVRNQR